MMFVILFGLSMDYEVFLMSRIHEEFVATGDPRAATVRGLGLTARVITTAALIMMAVFLAYVSTPNPTIKLLGFGMAVAVLLDSTVVRCVLVPSIMELLGRAAWWLPSWLRWLPRINVEGAPPVSAAPARPATERGQGDERDERESVGATNG
jgi:RND superfamily putative drug exporter